MAGPPRPDAGGSSAARGRPRAAAADVRLRVHAARPPQTFPGETCHAPSTSPHAPRRRCVRISRHGARGPHWSIGTALLPWQGGRGCPVRAYGYRCRPIARREVLSRSGRAGRGPYQQTQQKSQRPRRDNRAQQQPDTLRDHPPSRGASKPRHEIAARNLSPLPRAHPRYVCRRLGGGKSLVAWAAAAQCSSSVRRPPSPTHLGLPRRRYTFARRALALSQAIFHLRILC